MPFDDASFDAELRALLAEGRKIEAIKLYRQETGAGLAKAKKAVEALERGEPRAPDNKADASLEADLLPLLQQGRKIEAVKLYRERTNTGLKEAKEAVESLAADRGILPRQKAGCLGALLLLGLLAAGATAIAAAEYAISLH